MIIGRKINLRDIETADADFVLSLRCNEKKSKQKHQRIHERMSWRIFNKNIPCNFDN